MFGFNPLCTRGAAPHALDAALALHAPTLLGREASRPRAHLLPWLALAGGMHALAILAIPGGTSLEGRPGHRALSVTMAPRPGANTALPDVPARSVSPSGQRAGQADVERAETAPAPPAPTGKPVGLLPARLEEDPPALPAPTGEPTAVSAIVAPHSSPNEARRTSASALRRIEAIEAHGTGASEAGRVSTNGGGGGAQHPARRAVAAVEGAATAAGRRGGVVPAGRDTSSGRPARAAAVADSAHQPPKDRQRTRRRVGVPVGAASAADRDPATGSLHIPGRRADAPADARRVPSGTPADAREDATSDPWPVAGNPPPRYPRVARRRQYEGRVLLEVRVGADGAARGITIVESSGYPVLDRAAARAVRDWRFRPARVRGTARNGRLRVPVVFRLRPST